MSTVALIVPARNAQRLLRVEEDVVPQPRLEMALHLRQVEVRAGAGARFSAAALWKKYMPKSNSMPGIGRPSTTKWRSARWNPRGRTISVASGALSA